MNGQHAGYVWVSKFEQNAERQLDGAELDRTFTDKASSKDTKRPQLDTVVVHSMDRVARNLDDLRHIVLVLTQRGMRIEFTKEYLTFTGEDSPMANLMLSVMGAFAEFERALIRERQREGSRSRDSAAPIAAASRRCPMRRSSAIGVAWTRVNMRQGFRVNLGLAGRSTSTFARRGGWCRAVCPKGPGRN